LTLSVTAVGARPLFLPCLSSVGRQQPNPYLFHPPKSDADKYLEHIVPYVPTPRAVVRKMLEVAKVQPEDVDYDLGSGDGHIVTMAAQKFSAHAVGVELDSDLNQKSSERVRKLGLQGRAQIIHENMLEANVRPATVVTLYLLTAVNERLRPTLKRELCSGARIVSHDFQVPGWRPAEVVEVTIEN